VDKDTVMQAINISEDDFGQALEQFGDPYSENHAYGASRNTNGPIKIRNGRAGLLSGKKESVSMI
jgi:hypothetical protein